MIWKIPACSDGDHFYYKEKKISFTKIEDVKKRSQQAIRKNKPLLFHWRGGYLTREVLTELLEAMGQAAGTAAALACIDNTDVRKLDVNRLRLELKNNGVVLNV